MRGDSGRDEEAKRDVGSDGGARREMGGNGGDGDTRRGKQQSPEFRGR